MHVRDIMTRSVVTTTPATPVKDAAAVLAEHGVTLLPVLDKTDQLVGQAGPPPPRTVGEVMSSPPLTTHPDTDAAELASTVIDRGLRSMPIHQENRLVGIITRRDLVRTIARDDKLIAADIRKRLECYGAPDQWTVHVQQGSVTITDQHADPADHHVVLVLAQSVPGVVHAKVEHSTAQRT
jgi:CBS domain-containing protein